MNIKELRNIIDGLDGETEIACRPSSHGELNYMMLYHIEYNEDEDVLELSIED